jgi:invasion protein IalB
MMQAGHLQRLIGASAFGLFGALITAGPARADTMWNGDVFGDWRYECAPGADGQTNCALVQTIFDHTSGSPVVRLSISRDAQDGRQVLALLLPLGVELAEPASIAFDEETLDLMYRTCLVEGCLARRVVSQDRLRRVSATRGLAVRFYIVGQPEPMSVLASSRGLQEAFQRIGFMDVR